MLLHNNKSYVLTVSRIISFMLSLLCQYMIQSSYYNSPSASYHSISKRIPNHYTVIAAFHHHYNNNNNEKKLSRSYFSQLSSASSTSSLSSTKRTNIHSSYRNVYQLSSKTHCCSSKLLLSSTSSSTPTNNSNNSTSALINNDNTFKTNMEIVANKESATKMSNNNNNNKNDAILVDDNNYNYITGYLDSKSAENLDIELMQSPGYTLEQLMELAGYAVAEAVYQVLHNNNNNKDDKSNTINTKKNILILCGPGNNGGDGLVASRHLHMFGYDVTIVYPKRSTKQLHYHNLVKQCEDLYIPILNDMPSSHDLFYKYDAIIDAIFGFSFDSYPIREPFHNMIQQMLYIKDHVSKDLNNILIFSVDIPSGWDVNDDGTKTSTTTGTSTSTFVPDVLISLTVPKLCAKKFHGRHFIGGRFLPPDLAMKYNIRMPPYPGVSQVMEV